jgi:perosamine synthetase
MRYPVYTPNIQPYTQSAHKAIEDGWISSQGEFIEKAREVCKQALDVPYVVLVNNGTSATHLLYKALKFKYPGLTRVYVPDFVFAAVWNCALYEYSADEISVLKTDRTTLNMSVDEEYLQTLEPNSAVVIVHNVGNVVNVPRLKRLRPDLVFVEDCCEAFLETYEGALTGTESLCAAVSFFGNKIVTTGEGGLWYTRDKELYDFIYKSCHHGMTSERYVYDVLGYNYRMTNVQAALLFEQMQDIHRILHQKRKVYERYVKLLDSTDIEPATTGLWMFVARAPHREYPGLQSQLASKGIDTRPMFYSIHTHPHLRAIRAEQQDIGHSEVFMLPSSPTLTAFDQTYIVHALTHMSDLEIVPATHAALSSFVRHPMPPTFRYFQTHTVDHCLQTHECTILGHVDGIPVAYGHLDDGWMGVCVLPDHQQKGYGRAILDFLLAYARAIGRLSVRLTVDLDNARAIALYERVGFTVIDTTERYHLMRKQLQ